MVKNKKSQFYAWIIAFCLPILMGLIQWLFWNYLKPHLWNLFFLTVIVAPIYIKQLRAGLLLVFMCCFIGVTFFMPMASSTGSYSVTMLPAFIVFCLVGVSSVLTHTKLHFFRKILRHKQNQLDLLLKHSPVLMAHFDSNLKISFANGSFIAFFYRNKNAPIGFKIEDIFGESIYELNKEFIAKALDGIQSKKEMNLTLSDKTTFPCLIEYVPEIIQDHGDGFFVFITDLSLIYKARHDFELYRTAIDQLAIVAITDLKGQITFINDNFIKMSGYTQSELIGKTHRLVNSGTHSKEFFTEMWSQINKKNIWNGIICNKNKCGELYWVDTTIAPSVDEAGQLKGFISIRFDITKRVLAEQQKLIANSKMMELGFTAAGVAHEINNSLTYILLRSSKQLKLIDKTLHANEFTEEVCKSTLNAQKENSEKILKSAERIEKIVKSLKNFSRNDQADPFEKIKINNIIEDVYELASDKLKHLGIQLRSHCDSEMELTCHPTQISQVLLNMVNNSIQAIEAELASLSPADLVTEEKWIQIDAFVRDDTLPIVIKVTDCGRGIPKETVDKMMTPFFSTKELGKGTGLGLSISKQIIERHGGKFYYNSNSENTQFVIELPEKPILQTQPKQINAHNE